MNYNKKLNDKNKSCNLPKWHRKRHFEAFCLTFSILFGS